MRYSLNYCHNDLWVDFEEILGNLDLIQMVNFMTEVQGIAIRAVSQVGQ